MPLTPGDKLGHYEILAPLGAGGMGEVYRARDTQLARDVAVKVLPRAMASDPERLARFDREAKILAALNHPNIATIYGMVEFSGGRALVMELVPGNPLSDRLQRGALGTEEALSIARQIADAMEAAHDKGIIHRDLKPGNVMITPEGVAKVLDFGLASTATTSATGDQNNSPTLTMGMTMAGAIMGTAAYMAPEQAVGKNVDKRADIWAFGVVLHELLTGKKLFHGETVSDTLASVLKDPIDLTLPQDPPAIRALLQRCLDRNLKHRLRDIGEARIAIEDFLANPNAEPPASKGTTPARPILWMTIAGAAVLIAIATITLLWLRPSPQGALASRFTVPIISPTSNRISVSPDGKWLLKRADGMFYLRPLDGPDWRKVAGTEAADSLSVFWSPDSGAFGFLAAARLRVASLDGSPPRDVMEVRNFQGASWRGTRDGGTILLAIDGKLKILELRTGKVRDLSPAFKAGSPPSDPVFLPEGDGFVFVQDSGEGKRLFRSALNSSAAEPLFLTTWGVQFAKHPGTGNWHVFYLAGERELQSSHILLTAPIDPGSGRLLSAPLKLLQGISTLGRNARFSVSNGGVLSWTYAAASQPIMRLAWTDLTGNLFARISEPGKYVALALSPDESKIAVQVEDPDPRIWIFDSKTGLGGRLSTSPDAETSPQWAPDGKSLFYVARTAGATEIRRSLRDNAPGAEVIWVRLLWNDDPVGWV
jgi:serine/threonine-protein kinase